MPDYTKLSVEDLRKAETDLAKQKTSVREEQNAVAAELAVREALAGMPDGAREIVKLRLEGGVKATGEKA